MVASVASVCLAVSCADRSGARIRIPTTMPAWRAAIVAAAREPSGSRPPSAAIVSTGRASARPIPIRSWGCRVSAHDAPGRTPRAARPPAIAIPPASAAEAGGPARSAIQRAATVANGIAETVAAAATGERPHPSVRRITSRKRAPVRPAESRPRPTSGRRSRGPPGPGSGGAGRITVAIGISSSSGTWRKKIDCQSRSWVSRPPTAGPTAMPIVPAAPQVGAASRWLPFRRASSSIAQATARAPPPAWATRAATSAAADPEAAQAIEAATKRARPADQPARGCERAIRTAGRISRARTMLKAVRTQETPKTVASYSRRMLGSARVTIEESARTTPTVSARLTSVTRLWRVSITGRIAGQPGDSAWCRSRQTMGT